MQRVFSRHGTACVGCYLARFCTLKEVADAYGIPLDRLLEELREAALAIPSQITGADDDK